MTLFCPYKAKLQKAIHFAKKKALKRPLRVICEYFSKKIIIAYLIEKKPQGICSVIISSGHPSSSLWAREQHRMIALMPHDNPDYVGDWSGEFGLGI